MKRRGMTLIELVVFVWLVGCVAGGAAWGGVRSAWLVIPGMLAGLTIGLLLPTALFWSLDRLFSWRWPPRPTCFAGRCRAARYTLAEVQAGDGSTRWRCACGDDYVRRGERFVRLIRGEVELPYMRQDANGRWVLERCAGAGTSGPRGTDVAE